MLSQVTRSSHLLVSLSAERERWEFESSHFRGQLATVVGDCLIAAAFLAYIGYYDEHQRTRVLIPGCAPFRADENFDIAQKEYVKRIESIYLLLRIQWEITFGTVIGFNQNFTFVGFF